MGYSRSQVAVLLGQICVLSFSFECIFPFVNQFLVEIGVVDDPADVGFYSGIVESTFSVTSLLAVFPLAWASDHYGRKPVIILGALGVSLSLIMFGLSTTYAMMIVSRVIGGAVGGSTTAVRVMASELSDRESETYIVNWISMAYRIGQIIGQPVGGVLAHPEKMFPKVFGGSFWRAYPYALPCFVGAGYAFLIAVLGSLILRETLPSRRASPPKPSRTPSLEETEPLLPHVEGTESRTTLQGSAPLSDKPVRPSIRSVLTFQLFSLLLSNAFMVLLSEGFFALYPLFAYTSIELGGLGLNSAQIGEHMSIRALIHLIVLIPCSAAVRKWGRLNVYRISLSAWLPTLICFPMLNWLARNGLEDTSLWYAMLLLLWSVWSVTGWSWAASFLLISDHSPNAESLSTVQGLFSSSIIAPQAIAPALATSTFTLAIKNPQILNGNAFWVASVVLCMAVFAHSFTLRESVFDWRAQSQVNRDDTSGA
ncbi:MFS general substrate transporter [Serendipita vermifera]|nr:MFS general substrate transporter [Serendipita vermifera]